MLARRLATLTTAVAIATIGATAVPSIASAATGAAKPHGVSWTGHKAGVSWTGHKAGVSWTGHKNGVSWTGHKAGVSWTGTAWT